MSFCKAIGCHRLAQPNLDFCLDCVDKTAASTESPDTPVRSMAERYPQYYKDFSDVDEADVYLVHHKFNLQDPSGCLQHSSKKILLAGTRTGGKAFRKDILEARDTLTRWLQINPAPTQ